MSAGAFSDPKVMEASKKLVCVFVDCNWGKKNADLSDRFKVDGYPTVVFCDPEGKEVGQLGGREPGAVAAQIEEVAKKYGRGFDSFEKAAPVAHEGKKPVLYVFTKPNMASSLLTAVGDPSLKDIVEKFVLAHGELVKGNAEAKALSVTESTLLVLEPEGELAKAKVLLKMTGKKETKEVRKQLEAALKKFEEGSAPK